MSKRSIQIVDDEPHVVRVLRLMLEREGYAVLTAYDGAEALARMAGARPDVMITDIQMAGMNGRELCRKVREHYPDEPFLILVMTSMTAAEERSWVRELDNVEFLEKPVTSDDLLKAIETALLVRSHPSPPRPP